MVVKSVLSAGVKQLTKGLSKKAAAETVELIGRQTMNDIGELVIKDPSRLKYVSEVIASNPRNFKALNDITEEAATQRYNSQLATKTQNFASGGNYTRPDAAENLQAAGAEVLTGRKSAPRTIQGPVPPKLAEKTGIADAQSYEEAVMAGTTKFTEDGVSKQIRNYGAPYAPHGQVTVVGTRKISGRGTYARLEAEKLLTLGDNVKDFYSNKLPGRDDAHHWNPIGIMKRVVDGMPKAKRNAFIQQIQDELGLFSGNHIANLRQLDPDIHRWLHRRLEELGYNPATLKSFKGKSLKARRAYLQKFAEDLNKLDEELFQKNMESMHGSYNPRTPGSGVLTNPAMDETLAELGISKEMLEGNQTSGMGGSINISDRD